MFVLISFRWGEKSFSFLSTIARVRSGVLDRTLSLARKRVSPPRGGSDLDSSEVVAPLWNVGGFIGHGRGVDKEDEFPFVLLHVGCG